MYLSSSSLDILASCLPAALTLSIPFLPASPSTLLAILYAVNHLWRQEEETRNSLAIAKQAGSLYDKLVGFIEAFEEIGSRLYQTRDAWETARRRPVAGRGNLIRRAEKLKELGVQSSKALPSPLSAEEENQEIR